MEVAAKGRGKASTLALPFAAEGPWWDGDINAELFVTNYRYGSRRLHELDRWTRHVVLNSRRKLPVSGFALNALTEGGVAPEKCRVAPLGYSPEIARCTR